MESAKKKDEQTFQSFKPIDYAFGLLVFFVSFSVYLRTLTPTIGFHDSGELITCAWTLWIDFLKEGDVRYNRGMKKKKPAKQKEIKLPFFLTKETIIVISFLILALIFRLIYLSQIKEVSFLLAGGDMITYHNQAIQILNGSFPKEPYYYNPFYSYFLFLIYSIFGPNPYTVRTVQAIMGVILCLLVYLITRNIFDRKSALIALFLSTIYGLFMLYEASLLIETLSTFLITLSLFFLLKSSWKVMVFSGIFLGLSALTRANILLFIPFILIWMMVESNEPKTRIITKFCLLCVVVFLTISPATIRNYLVSGKFVLISTNGPVNFWMGNNRYADGQYYITSLPFQKAHQQRLNEIISKKGDRVYFEDVMEFARLIHLNILDYLVESFYSSGSHLRYLII